MHKSSLFRYTVCREPPKMELHLESLPDLVLLKIFNKLSLPDCYHLSEAFGGDGPVIDSLRTSLKSLQLEELVLRDAEDLLPIEFFEKNDVLWPKIRTIRFNINLIKLPTTSEYLHKLIQICSGLCALKLEKHDIIAIPNDPQLPRATKVNQFLAALDVARVSEVYQALTISQNISLPQGLKKCAINASSIRPSIQAFSETIDTLHISFDSRMRSQKRLTLPALSGLTELSLQGITLIHYCSLNHEVFQSVRVLRLQPFCKCQDLNSLIMRLPNLECLHVDFTKMAKVLDNLLGDDGFLHEQPLSMPRSLKELHVRCRSITKIETDFWRCLFDGYWEHQELKMVTQDYHFHEDTMSKTIAPRLDSPDFQLIDTMAASGVFQDLYFNIHKLADWKKIISLMRQVPATNRLYLFICLNDELELTQIMPAMPPITTSIKLLSVNDFHNAPSFNILSSFTNVDEFDIHCDMDDQFFQACRLLAAGSEASSPHAWRLHIIWSEKALYDQLLDFANITELTIDMLNETQVDLAEIRRVAGAKLQSLTVYGEVTGANAVPCIDPHGIKEVLHFDKLKKFVVNKLPANASFQAFLDVLEGMKPFRFWHAPLTKMLLFFVGSHRKFICLENFSGVTKMRHTGPFPDDN